jgi:hypothetical protein
MLFPEGQIRVFVYGQPVSMRLSYDGLYALARHGRGQNPLSGSLFAFINRGATPNQADVPGHTTRSHQGTQVFAQPWRPFHRLMGSCESSPPSKNG